MLCFFVPSCCHQCLFTDTVRPPVLGRGGEILAVTKYLPKLALPSIASASRRRENERGSQLSSPARSLRARGDTPHSPPPHTAPTLSHRSHRKMAEETAPPASTPAATYGEMDFPEERKAELKAAFDKAAKDGRVEHKAVRCPSVPA